MAVEASPGHIIGVSMLTGDLVAWQMRRTFQTPSTANKYKKIYRALPTTSKSGRGHRTGETMIASRQIAAADMDRNMKIGDVGGQGDKIKAITTSPTSASPTS